jgi:hypothetical protein
MRSVMMYVIAFVAFGTAGVLTLYVTNRFGEQSDEKQLAEFGKLRDSQTRELLTAMADVNEISKRITQLAESMEGGDTGPNAVSRLRDEASQLAMSLSEWVGEVERRKPIVQARLEVEGLSATARADKYNGLVGPYYARFLTSLDTHVNALIEEGWEVQVDRRVNLPERFVHAREPVISGHAEFLVQYTFPSGRKWTAIFTSGGASNSKLSLPYFRIALATLAEHDHGPNYFELHMQDKQDAGVVFSLRSNFESVQDRFGIENGRLEEFAHHFDEAFRVLLEEERARE